MWSVEEIEDACRFLRDNGATARRKAIKRVLELTGKESNRAALSAMGSG